MQGEKALPTTTSWSALTKAMEGYDHCHWNAMDQNPQSSTPCPGRPDLDIHLQERQFGIGTPGGTSHDYVHPSQAGEARPHHCQSCSADVGKITCEAPLSAMATGFLSLAGTKIRADMRNTRLPHMSGSTLKCVSPVHEYATRRGFKELHSVTFSITGFKCFFCPTGVT